MPLRPELQALADRAAAVRIEAEQCLSKLSNSQLSWSPGGEVWSIAQILDHLNKEHGLTLPIIEDALASAPAHDGPEELRLGFLERMLVKLMTPGAKIKIPVPPLFEPKPSADPQRTVLPEFVRISKAFEAVIARADGVRLSGLKVASPANSRFRFRMFGYLSGLVQHLEYHWAQVEALLANPGFPKV